MEPTGVIYEIEIGARRIRAFQAECFLCDSNPWWTWTTETREAALERITFHHRTAHQDSGLVEIHSLSSPDTIEVPLEGARGDLADSETHLGGDGLGLSEQLGGDVKADAIHDESVPAPTNAWEGSPGWRFGKQVLDVIAEAQRSIDKHGEQGHLPNGTGPDTMPLVIGVQSYGPFRVHNAVLLADTFTRDTKRVSQNEGGDGTVTWWHIFREEAFEAAAENEPAKLRAELVQVAAVALKWIEALDGPDRELGS